MKQLFVQNLFDDLDSDKQTLKQVEASDRISSQSELIRAYSVKTSSLKLSQNVINTSVNTEALSAQASEQITILQGTSPPSEALSVQTSEQITILQGASPPSEAEAEAEEDTILPNSNPQNSTFSVSSIDDVSLPLRPRVAQQIDPSSQPTQIKAKDYTKNPIARFPFEDDFKNHNNARVQPSDSVVQNLRDQTIIQYSDSAIHSPGEQTVCQAIPSLSSNQGQTLIQSRISKSSHSSILTTMSKNRPHIRLSYSSIRNTFRRFSSFSWQFTSIKRRFFYSIWRNIERQLQSLFQRGSHPTMGKILKQPSSTFPNYYTHNAIASGEQPNLEQYQQTLRELDLCRICFAKELARNGKFRSAIAEAEQISETSHLFKDAQMLIQSWK